MFLARTARSVVSLAQAFDSLIFPRWCLICGDRGLVPGLCEECHSKIVTDAGQVCTRCGRLSQGAPLSRSMPYHYCADGRTRPSGVDQIVPLGSYEGALRELCIRLKYVSHAWLATTLVNVLIEVRGTAIRDWLAQNSGPPPCVVAVPLHWTRRWMRRYNQADALAEALRRELGLKGLTALRRVKRTRKLAYLTRSERALELRGAFRANRRASPQLGGRDLILVDDILTTGATCETAARALKKAGAGRILAVVLGRVLEGL